MAATRNSTDRLFEETLSGPEALAMLDAAIAESEVNTKRLKTLRAGLADLSGMDKIELPKTGDPIRNALVYFDNKHKELIHAPAAIAWGKDNAIMRSIVNQYNGQTERLIDEFFTFVGGADGYLNSVGFTVQSFKAKLPALLARLNAAPRPINVTRNTEDNSRAASRAAAMIRGSHQ